VEQRQLGGCAEEETENGKGEAEDEEDGEMNGAIAG
jgi:hypothetical protein